MSDRVTLRDIMDISEKTHQEIGSLRSEFRSELIGLEKRVNVKETKRDNLLGKVGIGIMIVSSFIAGIVTLIVDWVKRK